LLPVALFDQPSQFRTFAPKLWGSTMPCALDPTGAAYQGLGDGSDTPHAVVVLDPDGNVVFRGADPKKGNSFYNTDGKPPVPYAELKKAMEANKDKGLLGGLEVPSKLDGVAMAIRVGQLATAQSMLAKVSGNGDVATVKAELQKRLDELRQKKLALFTSLAGEEKGWEAYKVGVSYLRCFPKASDTGDVKAKLTALKSKPEVQKNLAAADAFKRLAASCYTPTKLKKEQAEARRKGMCSRFAEKHEGTEYGDLTKGAAQ